MNIMALIQVLDDELSNASGLPLTGKRLVNVDKCLDVISDLRINLPEEIKDAEQIVAQKNAILNDAELEAQEILAEAERRFHQMLDQHEVTAKAYEQAEQIVAQARAEAQDIRLGAVAYAQDILDVLERSANQTLSEIDKNRDELEHIQAQ